VNGNQQIIENGSENKQIGNSNSNIIMISSNVGRLTKLKMKSVEDEIEEELSSGEDEMA